MPRNYDGVTPTNILNGLLELTTSRRVYFHRVMQKFLRCVNGTKDECVFFPVFKHNLMSASDNTDKEKVWREFSEEYYATLRELILKHSPRYFDAEAARRERWAKEDAAAKAKNSSD